MPLAQSYPEADVSLTVFYTQRSLTPAFDAWGDQLAELASILHDEVGIDVRFVPLPDQYAQEILGLLDGGPLASQGPKAAFRLQKVMKLPATPGLVVAWAADSTTLQLPPHAAWGAAVPGLAGIVTNLSNKYVLWHEVLHVLGADDCYDEKTGVTLCHLGEASIMKYAPENHVWPFLCERRIGEIRNRVVSQPATSP
jgi:hypothetical protein